MSEATARSWTKVEVSQAIVRACARCGHAREAEAPCAGCGLTDPPVVHDLGVQSYSHKNPLRRLAWRLFGQHMASRRAREAARYLTGKEA